MCEVLEIHPYMGGFLRIRGTLLGSSCTTEYHILGFALGCPYLGKLPDHPKKAQLQGHTMWKSACMCNFDKSTSSYVGMGLNSL